MVYEFHEVLVRMQNVFAEGTPPGPVARLQTFLPKPK